MGVDARIHPMSNPISEPTVLGSEQAAVDMLEPLEEIVMDSTGKADDQLSKASSGSCSTAAHTPPGAVTPPTAGKRWELGDDGEHDVTESWHRSMKHTMDRINDLEKTPLGLADVCKYELNVLIATFVPMLIALGSLMALLYPFYTYAREAIPILLEKGFLADAEQLKKLRLCPPNAGDDCVDPRFVMTYGVQEQFGQIYDGYLPQIPSYLTLSMIWVPLVFTVTITLCAVVAASKQAVVDGKKQSHVDFKGGWKAVGLLNAVGCLPVVFAQAVKSLGKVSSTIGSGATLMTAAVVFWLTVRKVRKIDGDHGVPTGYLVGCIWTGMVMVGINQFVMKKVTSQTGLCVIWFVWSFCGEITLTYWRMKLRNVDLSKVDSRIVPLLAVPLSVSINCGKRIPLLALTDYSYIIVMNVACFMFEVFTRLTVVQRDGWVDRKLLRKSFEECEAWKDALHRQCYLHNEMIQEMLELLFPVPITITLFMIQYSPEGRAVLLAPIVTNCAIQIVQELIADCLCIVIGSRMQGKFYRVAKSTLFTRQTYALLVVIVSLVSFSVNGLYFFTYLRVGLTRDGHYLTVI
jgi:hypothetical protein